ncbi:MAG: uracil-DNA glycosylase [Magnetococcales bacterium]|nr:uracil-DNA glycosylase [Magnetococcales bacterium]
MANRVDKKAPRILCLDCRHFKITWEPSHPRACQAMGFKTKNWPCFEVLNTSGEPCMKFSPKPGSDSGKENQENRAANDRLSLKV